MKCAYKQKRKGTRDCPALGGKICSRCCGRHRLDDIECPRSCVWLQRAVNNHRKKYIDSGELYESDFFQWLSDRSFGDRRTGQFMISVFSLVDGYLRRQSNGGEDLVREGVRSLKRVRTGSIQSVEEYPNRLARLLDEHLDDLKEQFAERFSDWQALEEELLNTIDDALDRCEGREDTLGSFLRDFYEKYNLPEFNPVDRNELYTPDSDSGSIELP